jgi:putative endopeptidase
MSKTSRRPPRRRPGPNVAFAAVAFAATLAAAQTETPLKALPYTPSLDVNAMDRTADPCTDLYRYSCGGWMAANPIPQDQSRWSVYGKLYQDNQRFLWGILDDLAKATSARNANQQKIGDDFAACMDEGAVEKLGARPLKPYLDAIAAIRTKRDLAHVLARLHAGVGSGFFSVGSNQDYADSTQVIAWAYAGGLGLPDRDYYTKDDERSRTLREQYVAHVERMFALLGDAPDKAGAEAATVMEIETALARASLTRVERRDPYKLFHKMDRVALIALTPSFDWNRYLRDIGIANVDTFNVTQPDFYKELDRQLSTRSLDEIRTYLRWHLARAAAPYLSSAFVNENFAFYGKTLRGTPQLRPRWKRCVTLVDSYLGEALGQEFVRRAFGPELKASTLRMAKQVEQAMAEDIRSLDWMSDATKAKALEKLAALANKIGYPDKWRDYSALHIRRGDFFGNVERAERFEARRQLAKIGKPVDRAEWQMSPPTVNAYYSPQLNDINFPAGVLQPPLYDPKMDDAPNYGNTGGTIGHELTHGFDDRGRQFDAQGNLKDWWTKEDDKAFTERAQCIVDQYAQYTIVDDIRINSKLTLGEDIADLGGLILGWMAWKMETKDKALEPRDGLTPEQRFFVGYAQWTCEDIRPEELRVRAITDQHSPGKYRVNGLVANMPEFARAFSCKPGAPLNPEKRCRVW